LNEARALPAKSLDGYGPRCGFEREHTLSTMHTRAKVAPRIGRSLKANVDRSEARFNTCGRSARAVRPASLAASARLWLLERPQYRATSGSNSGTLRASQTRGVSMQRRAEASRNQVPRAQRCGTALCKVASSARQEMQLVFQQPPNPSIEGTASGLRPPPAPHVKR
jgi:hypothetical protein